MLDVRCWILDVCVVKCCVRIYEDKKEKFHGAMWSSHPTKIDVIRETEDVR